MGQFLGIFNFLVIFLTQTGRYLLGSMHNALDFQILTGNDKFMQCITYRRSSLKRTVFKNKIFYTRVLFTDRYTWRNFRLTLLRL